MPGKKVFSNREVADVLFEMGELLAMQGVEFKPRAYEKAAQAIRNLEDDLQGIYEQGSSKALKDIPGVGASIAETIEELLTTGHSSKHEELKSEAPVDITGLEAVEGIGAKTVQKLYQELDIKNLEELEKAAKAGKIRELSGFGEKTEENILKGIEFVKKSGGRFVLGFMMSTIRRITEALRGVEGVERVTVAGSTRRKKETIGDVDILVISQKPGDAMDFVVSMPEVVHVYAKGETKSSIKLESGIDVDVRVVPKSSYGSALNYFTGSKSHNVALRKMAIKQGHKLNEYGLYERREGTAEDKWKKVAGETEEGLYEALGLAYIPPELREMTGELDAALRPIQQVQGHPEEFEGRQARGKPNGLPKLVGYDDLRGDLQIQTNWSDGANSIEEMAREAIAQGLSYIAITDHTKSLAMTGGLDENRLQEQAKEIENVNQKLQDEGKSFTILKSTECDILRDGSLDLADEALAELDVVGIAVHSHFNLSEAEQTSRIINAMENPNVDILFHPTGRVLKRREAYALDMGAVIEAAKDLGVVLEIDAYPDRLDLKDEHIRMCVEAGVKMSISSDAHAKAHIAFLEYGIAQARRGWAEKDDIVNTRPVKKLLKSLRNK